MDELSHESISTVMPVETDVVVVGAGLSGLYAAYLCRQNGLSTAVLEARNRIGGRILTQLHHGVPLDLGAQWIGPTQRRMAQLCQTLDMPTFPTYAEGRKVLALKGRVSTYDGTIPKLNPWALFELNRLVSQVEKATAKLTGVHVFNDEFARQADQVTVAEWATKFVRSKSVRDVLRAVIRVVFGADPHEISLHFFLRYCKAGGGLLTLCEVDGGAQQTRIVGGTQSIPVRLANRYLQGAIQLEAPVYRIDQTRDDVRVYTSQGEVIGQQVIVALPPPLSGRITFSPPLSAARDRLVQRQIMGSTIKCHVLYAAPFWREAGFSGEVVSDGRPLSVVLDNCTMDGRAALVGFIVGHSARVCGRWSEGKRRTAVVNALVRCFGEAAQNPLGYVDHDWGQEQWSRGCPIAFAGPGGLRHTGLSLTESEGRIHWAGTEAATEWIGFMEGALCSAERAVKAVMDRL
ncbi:MAG: FAD-dependent oxidoreductase [Myxococcota bacterium]|nr:FAD-dependent oxidoreductase [Myxococcota bacterium]